MSSKHNIITDKCKILAPIEEERYYYAEALLHYEACLLISIIHIEPYTLICMALLYLNPIFKVFTSLQQKLSGFLKT